MPCPQSISGLVVEYIVAIDVTRVRFPADASYVFAPLFAVVGLLCSGPPWEIEWEAYQGVTCLQDESFGYPGRCAVHIFTTADTVAILAQGTNWAVAVTQAFFPLLSLLLPWHSCDHTIPWVLCSLLPRPSDPHSMSPGNNMHA